jgi:transposase
MRGHDEQQESMFSYISPEKRVPSDHPLRRLRAMVDAALEEMSPQFARLYSRYGRPSIAPEKLLRALLQVLYSVRSERLLMEQLGYNLLFRWFVGLSLDDGVWDVTVFTKNRERLLEGEIAEAFFEQVVEQARAKELLSDEHFTVDGTLVQAWAGQKSFRVKKGKGEKRQVPPEDPGESDGGFSRGKAQQRNARLHDGPGGAAVQEECGERSEVELPGACAGGESQRAGGPDARESGDGHGRARSGARDDRSAEVRAAARDAGRRQRI